jgi:hypothetical protein
LCKDVVNIPVVLLLHVLYHPNKQQSHSELAELLEEVSDVRIQLGDAHRQLETKEKELIQMEKMVGISAVLWNMCGGSAE